MVPQPTTMQAGAERRPGRPAGGLRRSRNPARFSADLSAHHASRRGDLLGDRVVVSGVYLAELSGWRSSSVNLMPFVWCVMRRSRTARTSVRQLPSPENRPITFVRRLTSSSGSLEQIGASPPQSGSERVAQVHDERVEVGQAPRRGREAALVVWSDR
jgi:hypothetical protein